MTDAVPPRVEVPVGAGVSLATVIVAVQVVTGAVVESLHATPMTATSIACNLDVRIASPSFQVNVRLIGQQVPVRPRTRYAITKCSGCRASRPGQTHPPFRCPGAYPNGRIRFATASLARVPEQRLVTHLYCCPECS